MGELAALMAAMCWGVGLTGLKSFDNLATPRALNYFKTIFSMTLLVALALILQSSFPTDITFWFFMGLSGVLGIGIGDTMLFKSLQLIGSQYTTMTMLLVPGFAFLLGWYFLGEVISTYQWVGFSIIIFSIVLMVLTDSKSRELNSRKNLIIGLLLGATTSLLQAIGMLLIKSYGSNHHFTWVTVARLLGAFVILGLMNKSNPVVFSLKLYSSMGKKNFRKLCILLFLGSFIGLTLLTIGTQLSPVAIAAVLSSTVPIWAFLVSLVFLKSKPPLIQLPLAALGVVGVYCIFI